jgi:drug/metabolite transporter (DMT)-like permease
MQTRNTPLFAGTLWGLAAVLIWAGWWVLTRSSVSGSLQATDLAALRFGLAGLVMSPVIVRDRATIARVPKQLLFFMVLGAGAPYALVAAFGLNFASAGNGGALGTGFLPLAVTLLSSLLYRERAGRERYVGLAAILAGAALIANIQHWSWGMRDAFVAPALFFVSATMWAGFTLAMRRSGLSAMAATATVCVLSGALYLPVYALFLPHDAVINAPSQTVLTQALYQGILTSFGALFCFSQSVIRLGPARAAVFPALIPVAATCLGAAALHEVPSAIESVGVFLISVGAWRASTAKSRASEAAHPTPASLFSNLGANR